jgi:hypothetical protein
MAMSHAASSPPELPAGAAGSEVEARLPLPRAVLLIVTLSAGLWAGIALAMSWLLH